MKYRPYQKALVIIVPLVGLPLLALAAWVILTRVTFPTCLLYDAVGVYCPGCGATRSVEALLRGDLLLALRQNIAVPFLGAVALLLYLELALKVWGVRFRLPLLHSTKCIVVMLVLWLVYCVLRNFIPAIAPV